jgi:hypothetical protein
MEKLIYSDHRHLSATGEKEFGARLVGHLSESEFLKLFRPET